MVDKYSSLYRFLIVIEKKWHSPPLSCAIVFSLRDLLVIRFAVVDAIDPRLKITKLEIRFVWNVEMS